MVPAPPGTDTRDADVAEFDVRKIIIDGNVPDALGTRLVRRPGVDRVDVAQQHQQIGADQLAHERRQPVVVTEADLLRRHRVVLVDDRQNPQTQQPLHRTLRVAARRRVLQVARREQHLPCDDAVPVEALLIPKDEHVLTHGGRCLLGRQIGGPSIQVQVRDARGDGTGGHQHDLRAAGVGSRERVDERADLRSVGAADRRGADLDHDPTGVGHGAGALLPGSFLLLPSWWEIITPGNLARWSSSCRHRPASSDLAVRARRGPSGLGVP